MRAENPYSPSVREREVTSLLRGSKSETKSEPRKSSGIVIGFGNSVSIPIVDSQFTTGQHAAYGAHGHAGVGRILGGQIDGQIPVLADPVRSGRPPVV